MNLSELLNAAGEVGMYTLDPQWKSRLEQQRQQQSESEARVGMMKAQTEAVMPRIQAQGKRNLASVINALKSGEYKPEQIAAITNQLEPDERDIVGAALAGHTPTTTAKREGVEAKTDKTKADTDFTQTRTRLLPQKTEAEIAALKRRGAGGGKSSDPRKSLANELDRLNRELYGAQKDLANTPAAVLSDQPKLAASAMERIKNLKERVKEVEARYSEVAGLPRPVPPPAAPLSPTAAPTTQPQAPSGKVFKAGGRWWGPEDVQSGELQKSIDVFQSIALDPAKRSALAVQLRRLGIANPDAFLGGR